MQTISKPSRPRAFAGVLLAAAMRIACAAATPAAHAGLDDPLDTPALAVGRLGERPMLAVAAAGTHLVAAGSRGVVIVSQDAGRTWRQAAVPVQSDLVALQFPTPADGWAVGHDGVVLHSRDGGAAWDKQLDGRLALRQFERHYADLLAAGAPGAADALALVRKNYANGPNLPCLDVWFRDASTGYVVGSFGLLAATGDGGKTWQPWVERLDNPEMLNLNAVRGIGAHLFIAAERGIVFKSDDAGARFRAIRTGYGGSLFGVVGSGKVLVAYGLRGAVYRSEDEGETWQAVPAPAGATINAGLYDAAAGEFLLVDVAGNVLAGDATATHFTVRQSAPGQRLSGIGPLGGHRYLVSSMTGVRAIALP